MHEESRDKIFVELFFPAGEKIYEARLPLDLRIHEITLLLSKLMEEIVPGSYKVRGPAVLCDRKSGSIFSGVKTPRELGWKNGIQLLLL